MRRYVKGQGFLPGPGDDSRLRKGRSVTGMPKLAKNPKYTPPKPAAKKKTTTKRKTTKRTSVTTHATSQSKKLKKLPKRKRGLLGGLFGL